MKNLYGILGGNRGKLHRDMGENIADLANGFRSHLVLVDAFRILLRNGPVGGRLSDVELRQTVIASTRIMQRRRGGGGPFRQGPQGSGIPAGGLRQKNGRDRHCQDPGQNVGRVNRGWTPKTSKRSRQRLRIVSQFFFTWLFFFLLLKSAGAAIERSAAHRLFLLYRSPVPLGEYPGRAFPSRLFACPGPARPDPGLRPFFLRLDVPLRRAEPVFHLAGQPRQAQESHGQPRFPALESTCC